MAFTNFPNPTPVFPNLALIGFPFTKVPNFGSLAVPKVSGAEARASRQVFPIWEFEMQIAGLHDQTQNQALWQHYLGLREFQLFTEVFVACRGGYGDFLFADPSDMSRAGAILATAGTAAAPNLSLLPAADGVSTSFIPMRPWGPSGLQPSVDLTSWEPVGGIAAIYQIYFDGTPTAATFSLDSNRVNFDAAPGVNVVVTADLSYFFRCHFDTDTQDIEEFMFNLWQVGSCKFSSVKP